MFYLQQMDHTMHVFNAAMNGRGAAVVQGIPLPLPHATPLRKEKKALTGREGGGGLLDWIGMHSYTPAQEQQGKQKQWELHLTKFEKVELMNDGVAAPFRGAALVCYTVPNAGEACQSYLAANVKHRTKSVFVRHSRS